MSKVPQELVSGASILYPDAISVKLPLARNKQAISKFAALLALVASDIAMLVTAISLASIIRVDVLPAVSRAFVAEVPHMLLDRIWIIATVFTMCLAYEGLYTKRLHFWQEAKQITKAASLAFLFLMSIISMGQLTGETSRTVVLVGYILSIILLPIGRFVVKSILVRAGLGTQAVLILGAGEAGRSIATALLQENHLGYRIVGFLGEDPAKQLRSVEVNGRFFPVLGSFRDSDRIMAATDTDRLIVATPSMPPKEMVGLINRLQRKASSVVVIPDLAGVSVMGAEVDHAFNDQVLTLNIKNSLTNPLNMFAKRTFDLFTSALLSIIILPLMALIALAIKIESPGPAFFKQQRVGRNGDIFDCYKFRTMAINAQEILGAILKNDSTLREEWESNFKLKNDPRITRIGNLLRKTSLDELPQILNVLKGEMSLVGPRPIVQKEVPRFGYSINDFFIVRPGITGLWQVSGRNDIDYSERVRLEAWYVRNWSLWLDITILIRTVGIVLSRSGAY